MADDRRIICGTDLIAPEFSVEQVTLETDRDQYSDIVTVEGSFIERVTGRSTLAWYENTNYLNFLNLRLIFSFNQKQTEGLYYIKDIYNAYLMSSKPVYKTEERGRGTPQEVPLTSEDLTTMMESEFLSKFQPSMSHLLNDSVNPISPYYTSEHIQTMSNGDGFYFPSDALRPRGAEVSFEYQDLVYYDKPLIDILPFDPDTAGNIVSTSRRTGTDAQFFSDALEISPITLRLPSAPEPGEQNPIAGVPQVVSDHLSVHAVVYLDYPRFLRSIGGEIDVNPDFYMLNGGMGPISCVTVLGNGYKFPEVILKEEPSDWRLLGDAQNERGNIDLPFVPEEGIRLVPDPQILTQAAIIVESGPGFTPDSQTIDSPDRRILQDLRFMEDLAPRNIVYNFYDTVFNSLEGSSLDQQAFRGIHRDDSFSSLYLSRGLGDNARFLFHFDLVDYMAHRSHFPKLYRDVSTARDLIEEGRLHFRNVPINIELETQTKVMDMNVYRRQASFLAQSVSNDLPSLNNSKTLGPSEDYPEYVINAPRMLKWEEDIGLPVGPGPTIGIHTYEGSDFFAELYSGDHSLIGDKLLPESVAKYQYGAEVVAIDGAPTYLRKCYEVLENSREIILGIYDMIVNSVPRTNNYPPMVKDGRGLYDYGTGKTKIELDRVVYNSNRSSYELNFIKYEGPITVEKILQDQICIYVELLEKFHIQFQNDTPNFIETLDGEQLERRFITVDADGNFVPNYSDLKQSLYEAISTPTLNPQVILEISKAVDLLSSALESVVSSYFNDLDSSNNTKSKSTLEQAGICQRKLILLRHRHYFDETFTYGIKNKYGYSYLLGSQFGGEEPGQSEGKYGLARITQGYYRNRIAQEFNKYFISGKGDLANISQVALSAPYVGPGYSYFTPHTILRGSSPIDTDPKSRQTPAIVQPNYITNVQFAKYDVDMYGDLFADIIEYKYKMKYLDRVFYRGEKDFEGEHPTYTSVLNSLGLEHECGVQVFGKEKEYLDEIEQLKPSLTKGLRPTTQVSSELFTYSAQIAIEGGLLADNPTATSILNTQTLNNLESILGAQGPDSPDPLPFPALPPLKLSFGILGELELDPTIAATASPIYEQMSFNSMVRLRDNFGLNPTNVVNSIDSVLSSLPNQIKSMLVCATTPDPVQLAPNIEPRRVLLFDKDNSQEDQKVSYYEPGMPNDPVYSLTKDPMKVYAKMLTFWMNYKQLCVVEYLETFKNLDRSAPNNFKDGFISKSKVSMPEWRQFDETVMPRVKSGGIICRIRTLTQEDVARTLPNFVTPSTSTPAQNTIDGIGVPQPAPFEPSDQIEVVETQALFDLPVYNEYFILHPSEQTTPVVIQEDQTPQSPNNQNDEDPSIDPSSETNPPNLGGLIGLDREPGVVVTPDNTSPNPGLGGLVGQDFRPAVLSPPSISIFTPGSAFGGSSY